MVKNILSVVLIGLFLVGCVSAISVNYYYNPECGHCERIAPFINQIKKSYSDVEWNFIDTSKEYFNGGTPTLILNTNDGRNLEMIGSSEIPRYLQCELNEQSNLNCPTISADNSNINSWFIKE